MPKMKAVQVPKPGGDFEFVEREIPEPGPRQVRIRVQACGICHSDVIIKEGLFPGISYPRVPGHEVIGMIDEVGAGVKDWKKGERVGVGWHGGQDGTCPACRRGDFLNCANAMVCGISFDGGYQEFMVAPLEALARVPESLDAAEAAPLMCAGVTTFNSPQRCTPKRSCRCAGDRRPWPPGNSVRKEVRVPRRGDRSQTGECRARKETWSGPLYRQCLNRCRNRTAKTRRRPRHSCYGTQRKSDVVTGRRVGSKRHAARCRSFGRANRSVAQSVALRQEARSGLAGRYANRL